VGNIIANHGQEPQTQQYDDLKKKLLNEYKKISKKGQSQGPTKQLQSSQQQLQSLIKDPSPGNNKEATNPLNQSQASNGAQPHLNVYKPTFISLTLSTNSQHYKQQLPDRAEQD